MVSLFPHPASFRFRLTTDTLAFGFLLPATGRIRVFHALDTCAAGRTPKKAAEDLFSSAAFPLVNRRNGRHCPRLECLHIWRIDAHKQMESAFPHRKPIGRVRRRVPRQNHIHRAVVISLQTRTVVDAVAVEQIIDEEIIVTVCSDRPETAVKHLRIAFKVENVGLFSRQRIPVGVLFRLGVQCDFHRIRPKSGNGNQRTVGIFRTKVSDWRAEIAPLPQLF